MREIKFRGKRKDNNEWVYGGYMINKNGTYICDTEHYHLRKTYKNYLVYSDTIGQFTGLKDKNGVEIYEGDIVRFDYYEGLTGKIQEHIVEIQNFWELTPYSKNDILDLEVIGNIYEVE